MKAFDRFGYWCMEDGWWYLMLIIALSVGMWVYSLPAAVTISSKEWECTMSRVQGIDAVCVEYRHKGVRG